MRAADKGTFEALGIGTLVMPTKIRSKETKIMLRDTLYAPDIAFTLISIGKCDDAGFQLCLHNRNALSRTPEAIHY